MKRALFLLVLCMPIWVQAQTWFNFESRTVTNPEFKSEARTQTIEVYGDKYVIAAGKESGKQFSRFTAWDNNLTNMVTSAILDTGYFVSDMSILGDRVYFCGKYVDTNNVSQGIIGVFDVNDLISNSTFSYGIATINGVKSVSRLDTYQTGTNPIVSHIVAVGEPSTITQGMYPTCFISMHDSASVAFNIDVQSPTTQTQYYTEQLKDVVFTDAHVVTVSFVSPAEGFIIRLYNPEHPENLALQQSYYYDLSNTVDALALLNNEYAFNIAKITKDTIAVVSSAGTTNNEYYTLVNIIDITTSHAIVSNQAIVHPDKMIEIFDMEYEPFKQKLLLLENSNLSGNGYWLQSVTILTPSQTPMYIAPTNYLTHNSFLNDMEVLNAPYYLVGGISYATGYHQLFHTKDVASSVEYCNKKVDVKVVALPLGTVSNEQALQNVGATHQWTIKQVGSVTKPVTINCKKEN